MLNRLGAVVLLGMLLLLGGLGCGASPSKGAEKDKDMPKPAERGA